MKIGPFEVSLKRTKSPVQKRSWAELNAFFAATEGYSAEGKGTINSQLNEYRGWIHAVVGVIYRRVSEIDYKFFRIDTDEEVKSKNHIYRTINKIFVDPNDFMEFRFLKSWIAMQMDLTGHAFILREDDVLGLPYKLWPLNVKDFHKLEKGDTFRDYIKGFTFRINGNLVTYDPDHMLYFHFPDPSDPRDGCSPIKSQAYAVEIDHYLEVYERDLFKNSARPDLMLKYPENVEIEEEDATRIIASWKKKFRGEGKMHEIAIMDRGAEVEKLGVMNEDLALSWLAQWSQDKILGAYGVPAAKVGLLKDVNKSNQFSAETTFNSECIYPRLLLIDEVLTRGILQKFDERLCIRHNNPIPRDKEELIKEHKEKVGVPNMTINESREQDGRKPVSGGDSVYIPLNFIALSEEPSERPPAEPEEPEEEPEEEEKPKKFIVKEHYSPAWLDRKWYVFKAYTEGWERVWMTQLGRLFEAQQEEVIQNLERYWDEARSLFDRYEGIKANLRERLPLFLGQYRDKSAKEVAEYFGRNPEAMEKVIGDREPAIAEILLEALTKKDDKVLLKLPGYIEIKQNIDYILFDWDDNMRAFSRTGKQITGMIVQETANEELVSLGMDASFTLENRFARAYLGSKVAEFSKHVLKTKADQLRNTLVAGFKAGEGIRKLTQRVQAVYGSVLKGQYEALRIARTETISASNAGAMMGYETSGVVKEKGWLTTRDQRTRGADPDDVADHWNMDGDRVKLNEAFIDGRTGARMMHPGDTGLGAGAEDLVLCRCAMVPYTTSTRRIKDATVDGFLDERDLGAIGRARGRRAIEGCYA